jgi:hypothetical protein
MRNFTKISLALLMFVLTAMNSIVSAQSFEWRAENESYPSSTVYEFDIILYATGATTSWELAGITTYINVNSSFRNSGTITPTIVSGSSELLTAQVPTAVSYNANNYVAIAAKTPPGAGNGTIITQTGKKVCRIRLTNSVNFSTTAAPNLTWRWSTPASQVSAYVSGINTNLAASTAIPGQAFCKTPNYWNGSSWNKGLPMDTTDAVIFTGNYTGSLGVRTLFINSGTTYNVPDTSGGYLKFKNSLTNNGSCVFKSSASGTGRLDIVSNPSNVTGTGSYTVERFILGSSGRRYRYLSAPFSTGPSIASSWQTKIHITGNGTGGSICPS